MGTQSRGSKIVCEQLGLPDRQKSRFIRALTGVSISYEFLSFEIILVQRDKINMNATGLDDDNLVLHDQNNATTNVTFSLYQSKDQEFLDLSENVILEPIQTESYDLSYSCLLIPRFPSHQLRGDLADYLPQWLQQICVSYSWRLEFTSAQINYFQWALRVNVSVPPIQFMQAIRYETSKFILSNFGHIARENLSNDFWAPGHLVVLGTRPHPVEMIEQYIRLTRRHQGLHTL